MTLSGLDIVARSDDFEERAAAYELRAWQWAFLDRLDGEAELRDVAIAGSVDLDLAVDFMAESEAAGLVRVVSMTLHEYRHAHGIAAPSPQGSEHEPEPETMGAFESVVPAWMIEHHDEPVVAEHYDEPVSEPELSSVPWEPVSYVAEQHAEHVEEPMEAHVSDAAQTVAELVAFAPIEHPDVPTVEAEHDDRPHAVSFSIGDEPSAPEPVASNGHVVSYAWEPMSLVTSVAETPAEMPAEPPSYETHDHDLSDGISIHLSAPSEPVAEAPNAEEHVAEAPVAEESAAPERGSINFSFTPDMMSPPEPVAPRMEQPAMPAQRFEAAPDTADTPAPQLAMNGGQAPSNPKGDLVGNLIARAFTFRIK